MKLIIENWRRYLSESRFKGFERELKSKVFPHLPDFVFNDMYGHEGTKDYAIDRSEDAIKLCNNKHINTGIRFFSGEIDQVSNIDSDIIYDNIYCRFVIHAMPIEEEIVLIRNAFNLLKIGGSIFIECRTINDPMARKGEVISPTERINGHYRRFIIPAELEYRLKEAGFRVISLHEEENVSQYKDDNPVVIRATATKV